MDKYQRYLRKQQTIGILLYSSIVFILGVILYGFGLFFQMTNKTNSVNLSSVILKDIGLVMFGASVVTMLFGWITKEESITTLSYFINNALEKALQPTVNFLNQKAIKNFRWDCWLCEADHAIQNKYEGNYWHQNTSVSYKSEDLYEDVRVIFAIGNKDGVLKDFFNDERYVVKYKIECKNQELNVMDDNVCMVNSIKINNEELKLKTKKEFIVNGCQAKEYTYKVPPNYKEVPVTLLINYSILKWVPGDKRIYISKQVFDTTEEPEFRIQVSESLDIKNIVPDTTEISSLSAKPTYICINSKNPKGNDIGSCVISRCSMLEGSAIRFELQKV
jgi:hypothetical protein